MDLPVQLKNLHRQLGNVTVLRGLTAAVAPGHVVALLGKNGCGKTTLLETILGFAFPSAGEASLWGTPATAIDGVIKNRIGFVPQQDELLAGLNGHDHLDLFKAFRQQWNQALVDRLTVEWLVPMDINVAKMSVGQRQKLSILLALAHEPDLLILDEPVASLDPIARRQFLQQLVEIAADENRAVVFSTHIVSDVERVANNVWILRDGVFAYQGGLDELKESFARVTLVFETPFNQKIDLPHLVKQKSNGNQTVLTFLNWQPEMREIFAQEFSAKVHVEYLGLEDIFLELNQ